MLGTDAAINMKLPLAIKYQLIIFLILFALFIAFKDHDLLFLIDTIIATLTAVIIEMGLNYIYHKTIKIHDSAIISGLIVGFVLADTHRWWLVALAAAIAILGKYLIRIHGRHIFNPAAFGIFITTIFLGGQTGWHGTFLWYILLPVGLYFSYQIRRLELLLGYWVISLLFFGSYVLIHHIPLLSIFGYFSYFYIFIMIVEPKTTPFKAMGKLIFGAGIALSIFILSFFNFNFEIELAVLLFFNLFVPLLNKLPERRQP